MWAGVLQEMGEIKPTREFFNHASTPASPFRSYELSMTAMLSLSDIEAASRACKTGKSPGLDCIPRDILRRFPSMFAEVYQPLFSKAIIRVHQPIQFRGGILAEVFKNNGSPACTANSRALFISSNVGKSFHRAVRSKLIGPAERAVGALRYGAKRGASVVQVSQALILHSQAKAMRISFDGILVPGHQITLLRHYQAAR